MDARSFDSRSNEDHDNDDGARRGLILRGNLIAPNCIHGISDTFQPLHVHTSSDTSEMRQTHTPSMHSSVLGVQSPFGPHQPISLSYGGDQLSTEEQEIRAQCEERLDNAIRRASASSQTSFVPVPDPGAPRGTRQSTSPASPPPQLMPPLISVSPSPTVIGQSPHAITTERTKRRLSSSHRLPLPSTQPQMLGDTRGSIGISLPEPHVSAGYVNPRGPPDRLPGLSPIGSIYSIDQHASVPRTISPLTGLSSISPTGSVSTNRSSVTFSQLGDLCNQSNLPVEPDVWSVGSVIEPQEEGVSDSDTSAFYCPAGRAPQEIPVARRHSFVRDPSRNIYAPTKYPAQRGMAEPSIFDGQTTPTSVRISLPAVGFDTDDTRMFQTTSGLTRDSADLKETRPLGSGSETLADISIHQHPRRPAVKQKSVRWARRPSESPSPASAPKYGTKTDYLTLPDSNTDAHPNSKSNANASPSPGPPETAVDSWQLHSVKPLEELKAISANSKRSDISVEITPKIRHPVDDNIRTGYESQRPLKDNSVAVSEAARLVDKLGVPNKWEKLRKFGVKKSIQKDSSQERTEDRWGTALEHIKKHGHRPSVNHRRLLTAVAVLEPKDIECLIEALQGLRESIEASNTRLELDLRDMEPVSTVRMRRPVYHPDGNATRISISANRSSRSRGTRHEFARRSGGHRRADEVGQNRDEKVEVEVRVVFLKIGEIDTLKEFYYADAFIQAKWREPKLDERTTEELTISELEQFWNPLLYIDNILSETKETQWMMAQRNEAGEVYLLERRRIKGVFLETLELNDFPLDVQDLTITVTTERPDTEVDIIPDQNEMSAINSQTFVDQQEWKLHEHVEITKRIMKQEYSSSMKSHPCLSVTCRAARRPGYFYWNVFLIMFMISGLAFATFAVSPDKAELRLRLSFTLILTSVTFKYVITQSLPKISYLTYMDKYVLMSLAILCIISVWHAIVTLWDPDADTEMFNITRSHSPLSSAMGFTAPTLLFAANRTSTEPNAKQGPNRIAAHTDLRGTANSSLLTSDNRTSDATNATGTDRFAATTRSVTANASRPPVAFGLSDWNTTWFVPKSDSCSRTNRMACEEWQLVQQVEQHVFTSFVIIYVAAHAIFIFWLYFDASRRRREMRQKDKEYRKAKRKARTRLLQANCKDSCDASP